jgi:hypothetical protein
VRILQPGQRAAKHLELFYAIHQRNEVLQVDVVDSHPGVAGDDLGAATELRRHGREGQGRRTQARDVSAQRLLPPHAIMQRARQNGRGDHAHGDGSQRRSPPEAR